MNVRLTDRFELRKFNDMNMQLYEFREVDASKAHTHPTEPKSDWRPTGNYFQDVPAAAAFVYKRLQRDDPYRGDLAGALLRMEAIAAQLAAAASLAGGE